LLGPTSATLVSNIYTLFTQSPTLWCSYDYFIKRIKGKRIYVHVNDLGKRSVFIYSIKYKIELDKYLFAKIT